MTKPGLCWKASAAVKAQVEALLSALSLEEKIDLVSGKNDVAGHLDVAGSKLPPLALADGPAGVRLAGPAADTCRVTALSAPIALAATWEPDLARMYGEIVGAEMAATGHNVMLGPAVDIARAPRAGRTFESFGEDPLLQARLVAAEIEAIQAQGVQACLKHYIVNNQEHRRNSIDVRVDERTVQEIYLPPFAAAVRAGAAAVMGSYNRINGTFACENTHTLADILRGQLGFRGWVMSDYLANHSTVESAQAGLDWELGPQCWGAKLLAAVQSGQVAAETIDEMVRRILRPTVGLGLAERPLKVGPVPLEQHAAQARAIAEQGIVLLKNVGGLLPLSSADIQSIAVIGPNADDVSAAGGGSGLVQPAQGISVVEGVRQRARAGVRVEFAPGADPIGPGALLPGLPAIPSCVLTPEGAAAGARGLRAEYWPNPAFEGSPQVLRIEPGLDLNRGFFDLPGFEPASPKRAPLPADLGIHLSARWIGRLTAPASGDYTLSLTCLGSGRLYLDNQRLIDAPWSAHLLSENAGPLTAEQIWTGGLAPVHTARVPLVAGQSYAVRVEYAADVADLDFLYGAQVRLGWQPPDAAIWPDIAAAAELAHRSDVAIVVARTFESESMDRPHLRLPNNQDRLIRAVAAANPRTIVVLMTGGPVEAANWDSVTPAVLEAWFAGQEQGSAIARVLFGDVNPAGKLPLTLPRDADHTPLTTPAQYPGVEGAVHYSEGLGVGYRGYEALAIEPQYGFGHGLSYTTFAYTQLHVTPDVTDGTQPIQICFELTNTGSRAGIEVAQVYVGFPVASAEPPKRLAGWVRAAFQPGESRLLTVTIDGQSPECPLSFWNAGTEKWEIARGSFTVHVGASSRDIRLSGRFHVQ